MNNPTPRMSRSAAALTALALAAAGMALAQGTAPHGTAPHGAAPAAAPVLRLYTVTVKPGKDGPVETLTPLEKEAAPGTLIERVFTGQTERAGRDGRVTLNLDAGVVLVPNSVSVVVEKRVFTPDELRAALTYSLDGKTFSARPMKTVTVTVNGTPTQKSVPAELTDYRALRVAFGPLAAGDHVTVRSRIRVR